jgi:putative FmdB family regulatory protein
VPIYEYQCDAGHRFEKRQGFHDDPLRECAECGQPARRLLSPAGIIFKGSGWYITDSRKPASSSENGSSSSSSASSSADSSAKSESTTSETAKSESTASKKSETAA